MKVRVLVAEYRMSAPEARVLPPAFAPEVAFVGRSNVGKSSLLNALTDQKHLARTSRTPGQTRAINLFAITAGRVGHAGSVSEKRALCFVDLPGYGYAKVGAKERGRLSSLLSAYLAERADVRCVVQLVDSRHPASAEDVEVYRGLIAAGREVVLVATKIDSIPVSKRKAQLAKVTKPLGVSASLALPFSSTDAIGRDALWEKLWDLAA